MSTLERLVKLAQRRLWLNRWLAQWGWSLAAALALWLLVWLVNRLFGLYPFPAGWTLLSAVLLSLVAATVWLIATRDPMLAAATALDQAAGLRERVSTGLLLRADSGDPFETAVVRDAEAKAAGLTPRKFLPVRWPGSLSLSGIVIVVALFSLLLPEFDLLKRKDSASQSEAQAALKGRAQTAVTRAATTIDKIAEQNEIDLVAARKTQQGRVQVPDNADAEFRRRETLKKLDRLQDALKNKIGAEKFDALKETKKQLRHLGEQAETRSELSELISALAAHDFSEAKEAVKKIQEKLAKHGAEGGPSSDEIKKMQEQIKELAEKMKEITKAAQQKQQEQQMRDLQNTGMNEEDARRVLEQLSKKDPEQLKKLAEQLAQRLKDKGVTQEQMQKMLEKMQQQMKAGEKASQQCKNLAEKLGEAAKQMQKGNMQQAETELNETGEALSEMEQLEQALNDLESQLSELENAGEEIEEEYDEMKDELTCEQCNGTGFRNDGAPCPGCNGTGQCGGRGRGSGPRDRDDNVDTDTVNAKAKTKFGRGGGIVGQQFVKDKQLKGESSAAFTDASAAEEIDDTDAVERERIPRAYRKGVKRFFDRLDEEPPAVREKAAEPSTEKTDAKEPASDKPND